MVKIILFILLSILLILISWRSLHSWKNHGLYRFLAWEGILWLLIQNIPFWFRDPLGLRQVFSWICLIYSGYLVIGGTISLGKNRETDPERDDSLFNIEKTQNLITTGIYRYIRHPMYASLLFLTWGIYLKRPDPVLMIVALATTIMLILTVFMEEIEDVAYFGEAYNRYMKKSKRFIPFVY